MVQFCGDAVVNAANEGCLGGGGVDGAISAKGGNALHSARVALPQLDRGIRCRTGDAKITIGGGLDAKHCIHAVGPNYWMFDDDTSDDEKTNEAGDRLLHSAYVAAMARAREVNAATVGFCLLSAGIFRSGRDLADLLEIGLRAVCSSVYPGLEEVHIVAFTQAEVSALKVAVAKCFASEASGGHGAEAADSGSDEGLPARQDFDMSPEGVGCKRPSLEEAASVPASKEARPGGCCLGAC